MTVSSNAIRVQLPGGKVYAAAFDEAASKTGARSGLPTKTAKALSELVELSVATLNSGGASMIALEMYVHDHSIAAKLVGKGCTKPTNRLVKQLETRAAKRARDFAAKPTKAALTITFEV